MAVRGKTIMVAYGRITPTQKSYAMKQQPFQFRMRNSGERIDGTSQLGRAADSGGP
jgi:hypothetical protein